MVTGLISEKQSFARWPPLPPPKVRPFGEKVIIVALFENTTKERGRRCGRGLREIPPERHTECLFQKFGCWGIKSAERWVASVPKQVSSKPLSPTQLSGEVSKKKKKREREKINLKNGLRVLFCSLFSNALSWSCQADWPGSRRRRWWARRSGAGWRHWDGGCRAARAAASESQRV